MNRRRHATNHRYKTIPASAKFADAQLRQVLKAIEIERGHLARAQSLLECMKAAMEYSEVDHRGPYYPDLMQMATGIVRKSINALDPIHLPAVPRDRVKEEFFADGAQVLSILNADRPLLPPRVFTVPRRCALRIHRRDYSRALAREASSSDSASANISG